MVLMEIVGATIVLHLRKLMREPAYRVTGRHMIGEVARLAVVWHQIYVEHLESKERLRIQPAQLFNFS